jgi:hypothetical protein
MAKAKSKKKETTPATSKKSSSKGLTATEIVRNKIRDNSSITEEDMKNVRIDVSLPTDEAHQPLPISEDTERPKDEDKDQKTTTPWDVIS